MAFGPRQSFFLSNSFGLVRGGVHDLPQPNPSIPSGHKAEQLNVFPFFFLPPFKPKARRSSPSPGSLCTGLFHSMEIQASQQNFRRNENLCFEWNAIEWILNYREIEIESTLGEPSIKWTTCIPNILHLFSGQQLTCPTEASVQPVLSSVLCMETVGVWNTLQMDRKPPLY